MTPTRVVSIPAREPAPTAAHSTKDFRRDGDGYRFTVIDLGLVFAVDQLRRERGELYGELTVLAGTLAGARTVDGSRLFVARVNLSSQRGRFECSNHLRERARAPEIDWTGLVDELCARVITAERQGQPAVLLHTLARPAPAEAFDIDGVRLLRDHPVILFGDGGVAKSYMGLHFAGELAAGGLNVLFADWELAGEDHRDRLERLYGAEMPAIFYARCERPLTVEVDHLKRLVREHLINYVVCDSVAYAADGPPEAAEVAARYFRAVRQLGVGSLHIAHTNRSDSSDQKPFGSAFWHNSARATWYAKLASTAPDGGQLTIGLFNRKANLGPLRTAVGFEITFTDTRTRLRRVDIETVDELADSLPLWQRIRHAVARVPMTAAALAEDLGANVESIERTVRRKKTLFTRVSDGDGVSRIALMERRAS